MIAAPPVGMIAGDWNKYVPHGSATAPSAILAVNATELSADAVLMPAALSDSPPATPSVPPMVALPVEVRIEKTPTFGVNVPIGGGDDRLMDDPAFASNCPTVQRTV